MTICGATRVFALGMALAFAGVAVTSASAEEKNKEGGMVKGAAIGAVVPGVSAKTGAAVGAVSGGVKKSKHKNEDK